MRTIKFRGKGIHNVEWYYGDLLQNDNSGHCYIVFNFVEQNYIDYSQFVQAIQVDPNTVGQFTGVYDKDGEEIYEGDVVELLLHTGEKEKLKCEYKVEKNGFRFISIDFNDDCWYIVEENNTIEVIGNIHDNAEELKWKSQR